MFSRQEAQASAVNHLQLPECPREILTWCLLGGGFICKDDTVRGVRTLAQRIVVVRDRETMKAGVVRHNEEYENVA